MLTRFSAGLLAALCFSAAIVSGLALGLAPGLAYADEAKTLGTFGAWRGYVFTEKAGKVCYAAALPGNSLNAPKGRATAPRNDPEPSR